MQALTLSLDWQKMFVPSVPILEIIIRGTIVYLGLYFLLRFASKRSVGTFSISDILVLVLIADAAQNAMAGSYTSVPDGLILVATIIFWSWFLDWLGYVSKKAEKVIKPDPLLLIKHGKLLRKNMAKEQITMEELMAELRNQGVDQVNAVDRAYLESDGSFSVITFVAESEEKKKKKKSTR